MSYEALTLYNLFMIVCYGFILFTAGRIYEGQVRMKEHRERHAEAMVAALKARRG